MHKWAAAYIVDPLTEDPWEYKGSLAGTRLWYQDCIKWKKAEGFFIIWQ